MNPWLPAEGGGRGGGGGGGGGGKRAAGPLEPDTSSLLMDLFSLDSVISIIVTYNCLPSALAIMPLHYKNSNYGPNIYAICMLININIVYSDVFNCNPELVINFHGKV